MSRAILARQPIFDAEQSTCAYELLYRGDVAASDAMTATVLSHALNQFGIGSIAGDYPIFVNVSRQFLLSKLPAILPPERTVLEVLEDVPADQEVIAAMQHWKSEGFTLALDDFISVDADHINLLPYADIVKVDILDYEGELDELVQTLRKAPVKLLAEKVETHAVFEQCRQLGFDYYQGYFFSKPTMMDHRNIPDSGRAQLMGLLSQAMAADSPKELEGDIAHDLTISYKLLCYINSAAVGLRKQVSSIGHALNLMGLANVRAWLSMLLMASLAQGKPDALFVLALGRGRFLELLARARGDEQNANDYFVLGMFSLLDAMLDQDIGEATASIALPDIVCDGLFLPESRAARNLAVIRAIEGAKWSGLADLLLEIGVDDVQLASLYTESMQWADERVALINAM